MRQFIVKHVVARLPDSILGRLYPNRRLRKGVGLGMRGITIDPVLAELEVALTVRSRFPVELSHVDLTLTWNYTDYLTRIEEGLSEQIHMKEVEIPLRRKLTAEEMSKVRGGTLSLAGDLEFRTNFSEFLRAVNIQTVPKVLQFPRTEGRIL